jgi:hypothetical protein
MVNMFLAISSQRIARSIKYSNEMVSIDCSVACSCNSLIRIFLCDGFAKRIITIGLRPMLLLTSLQDFKVSKMNRLCYMNWFFGTSTFER